MRKWWNESGYTLVILLAVLALGLGIWGVETYGVTPTSYVVTNPTENQMKEILKGDPTNRVWFDDAHQVYQGSSIILVSLGTRNSERNRAETFLKEVGVNYEKKNQ